MNQLGTAATVAVPHHRQPGALAKAGSFLWHLFQMVLAMEAGMMIYHLLMGTLLAPTGYRAVTQAYPLIGYWMMAVSMALGMIAFMRYRKSTWRHCLEMSTAMLAPVGALTVLVLCYLIPVKALHGIGDPVMILAMAAYMLYRPSGHAHGADGALHHAQPRGRDQSIPPAARPAEDQAVQLPRASHPCSVEIVSTAGVEGGRTRHDTLARRGASVSISGTPGE